MDYKTQPSPSTPPRAREEAPALLTRVSLSYSAPSWAATSQVLRTSSKWWELGSTPLHSQLKPATCYAARPRYRAKPFPFLQRAVPSDLAASPLTQPQTRGHSTTVAQTR